MPSRAEGQLPLDSQSYCVPVLCVVTTGDKARLCLVNVITTPIHKFKPGPHCDGMQMGDFRGH